MTIDDIIRPDRHTVIEIDEVDYLINEDTVIAVKSSDPVVPLIRLYDGAFRTIDLNTFKTAMNDIDAIDYLEKRS